MAGGGRTYYATGTGRFSKGSEIRADAAKLRTATRKGELKVLTSFGTTQNAPKGTLSKEELLKVIRSGDTIKFGDGTSVKINAANKLATINRLVEEGQRQITPVQGQTGSVLGGQFRGQPTSAQKPTSATKPAPRGQPKPTQKPERKGKPSGKPIQRSGAKPSSRPTPKVAKKPEKGVIKPSKKGGEKGGKDARRQSGAKKGGETGGKRSSLGKTPKSKGIISSSGVMYLGNRRKGGGAKKDRKRGVKKRRKGGRTGRGRRK